MTFEKRKNSDKRSGISIGLALLLVLAGIFIGLVMNGDNSSATIEEFNLNDVDLSGEWIGTTTEDYNEEPRYDYRIVISQNGNEISGIGYLDMIEFDEIYAEERIQGTVEGNQLVYSEIATMVLENTTMDRWCHTQTTLTYDIVNGQETLVGSWEYVQDDPDCQGISGRVILTRQ